MTSQRDERQEFGSAAHASQPEPFVRVLAFAALRDLLGQREITVSMETEQSAGELLASLCERFPLLAPHRSSMRLAINSEYAHLADLVRPGDEVALIPPVAGG